ncbi:bifunctional diguanylate cyclase/phosphodiesterase [Actinoplanes sp. NPDC051470]|uniref:putative bifunctional diguanylate cyclase/phosphodiesterase n=1 Tax=Actinoplanes sp. NPDC051470 TaxID=3157224 RepID=UPI003415E039
MRGWGIGLLILMVLGGQVWSFVDPVQRPYVIGLVMLVLDIVGFVSGMRAARRGDMTLWRMIALGRMCAIVTFALLTAESFARTEYLWWVGVTVRLGAFGFFSLAVLLAPAQRMRGRERVAFFAETTAVVAGGFMVVWYFVINPAIVGTTSNLAWIGYIGYPVGDLLMLLAIAVTLLRGSIGPATGPKALLLAGMAAYLSGDALWSGLESQRLMSIRSPYAGCLIMLGGLLMTVAPMRVRVPEQKPEQKPDRTARPDLRWSHLLPVAAMVVGGSLMVVVTVKENDMLPWGGLVLGLITMAAAITVRQVISLRDSRDQIVTDALTGLANRTGLDEAIGRALRRHEPYALLLVDLDGFKLINDAYGHAAGDIVLTEVAHHLRSVVRAGDVAARIGGDEFAVLLTEVTTAEQAGAVAQQMLTMAAANPVRLGEDTLPIRASIGLTAGDAEDTPKELLRRADLAMYQVKRAGTHGWRAYDPAMTDRRAEDAALSEALNAPDRDLFVLYQPIVDLTTGRPVAVEALVRWNHPVHGLVSPAQFIPIAERSGAITEIGLFVLEEACRQLAAWNRLTYISVNLSPRQLQEPTLVHDILAIVRRTGIAPSSLVLEVTESAIVDQAAIAMLGTLRGHGIRIAVDDFGTGYSSLHYLTRLPVDILKIDRSFVAELNGTPEGSAITEAIIRLSHVLHLTTIAEGIETDEQAAELLALGCTTGQGFRYARPTRPADLDLTDLEYATRQP